MKNDRRRQPDLKNIRDAHLRRLDEKGFDRRKPPGIRSILSELDVVTPQQLEKAERHAGSTGIDITGAFIELGYISEEFLANWLSVKAGIPFIYPLDEYTVSGASSLLPEKYARQYIVAPMFRKDNFFAIAVVNPFDLPAQDSIAKISGAVITPVISTRSEIFRMIDNIYIGEESGPEEQKEDDLPEIESEKDAEETVENTAAAEKTTLENEVSSKKDNTGGSDGHVEMEIERYDSAVKAEPYDKDVIKEVNNIIEKAVTRGASDIHFDPGTPGLYLRFRIDGMLKDIKKLPKSYEKSITARIKLMASLDITETRRPQDGRIRTKVNDRDIDIRVSTLPAISGEKIVLRILDKRKGLMPLETLIKDGENLKIIKDSINSPHGIILITGPTGSGKTTTLYSALIELNTPERNIMTIEDPVEYQIERINQIQINPRIGLTFASGLRTFLRQDPNIILVGEIRDKETADIAIQAALTGHLVFSTLHTNDVAGTITRLLDIGIESYMIAATLRCVIAQRLIRLLCPACREKYKPDGELLKKLNIEDTGNIVFYRAKGCKKCMNTGYAGRESIYEIFQLTHEAISLISKNPSSEDIRKIFLKAGMKTLFDNGLKKVKSGVTSLEEISRVVRYGGNGGI